MPNGADPRVPQAVFAALIGRNQAPELFHRFNHTGVVGQTVIPRQLNLDRPLAYIDINWRGRVDISVANYTAVASEAPVTIIDRIRITGIWKGSNLTPIDLTGATAFAWPRCFGLRGSSLYINGTRQAEPSVPYQQLGATFGNIGTFDLDIWYRIPLFPLIGKSLRALHTVPYLWLSRDWRDTVQIQLNMGDRTSFGTPAGGTVVAFTAFGSGAGTPQVSIFTSYAILGPLRSGYRSVAIVRNEQSSTAFTAVANAQRLFQLQKQKTANIMVKTGRRLTGTTSGVNVYTDLRDGLLNATRVRVDNRDIRDNIDNLMLKEHLGQQLETIVPEGYLPISFVDGQSPRAAFRGDRPDVVGPGAAFDLVSDIAEANADNLVEMTQEQVYADGDDPFWSGTR